MNFVYIKDDARHEIESREEYKQAQRVAECDYLTSCWADFTNDVIFFHFSEEGNYERPPGEYLLFIKGQGVSIRAYRFAKWQDGVGRVVDYLICSVDWLAEGEFDRDTCFSILLEAFKGVESRRPMAAAEIKLDISEIA
ncbi:hypothetical protein [Parachitinimonas caeni]|uniref:Uncharacterized protein n=1 Tax=Parachitinimonas caeni TaxID=3031301 RepID=A0ABT7E0I1_9NEIS|nr:hypothetical protein [Parachitinimonas caeni]MDK2125826.1 hypothetical protein [Parachitinimonas caeni]